MTHQIGNWRKSTLFTLDCLAVLAGALIAAPFIIVLASPFITWF